LSNGQFRIFRFFNQSLKNQIRSFNRLGRLPRKKFILSKDEKSESHPPPKRNVSLTKSKEKTDESGKTDQPENPDEIIGAANNLPIGPSDMPDLVKAYINE
jgi:hypothetical protein